MRILLCTALLLLTASLQGQNSGKYNPRHEFISYTTRQAAESQDPNKSHHYMKVDDWVIAEEFKLNTDGSDQNDMEQLRPPMLPKRIPVSKYRALLDIPYMWLDRDMFLHIDNAGGGYAVYVNDRKVGESDDSRTPTEFEISKFVTDGANTMRIEVYGNWMGYWMENLLPQQPQCSLGDVYIYSQPKIRIDDFTITAKLDSAGVNGVVRVEAILSNSYRSAETVTFGYDIYKPDGDRHTTNMLEVTINGEGRDTVRFREWVYPSSKKMWSPQSPNLYTLILFIRRDGRMTEYIPFDFGFNETQLRDGKLYINRKEAVINAANYNAASTKAATLKELQALKRQKINTVCVSYPQPRWFYELCDKTGMYVIDQANVNSAYDTGNRNVGGAVINNRDFLNSFEDRILRMQGRSKNYTSVIATSMGGDSGNGYNLYKSYQKLKAVDTLHAVTYRDPQGEWNYDMVFPDVR